MNPRWPYFVLTGIGVAAIVVVLVSVFRLREPVYQGQPLSYWSQQAYSGDGRVGAYQALRAIGPAGVPFLFKKLRRQDSISARAYRALWPVLPVAAQNRLPSPRRHDDSLFWQTSLSLALMGATVPQLVDGLANPSSDVRLAVIWALPGIAAHWRAQGTNSTAAPLLAALDRQLSQASPDVWASAALVLGQLAPERTDLVPVLVAGLGGGDLRQSVLGNLQIHAPNVLGRMGTAAQPAVPELKKLLDHPQPWVRVPAGLALWQIDRDTNAVSFLAAELDKARQVRGPEGGWLCAGILDALRQIGAEAKPAEPVLREIIQYPRRSWGAPQRSNVVAKARLVLRTIDPDGEAQLPTLVP